ncbi:hypothetical protein MM182_05095 [Aeromonas sp. MR19]|uniref:hypothetical protein n=1 Tax=Aeromonas TaxID=642 RepID=UPI001F4AF60B|nr:MULTISPECIES: hypothetical protein [unclassified Aeromonas]MCH7347614.1 hypothetical protein [Aeromonas sp. MR7]MCH7374767.1 hypothetical protein [Aeromonas sp. MR19]
MKTALLLIACWLLTLIPQDQGLTPLFSLLFHPDRDLYGTAQLTGFGGILLTLYLANLGVEVVLRRRFQIAGMLTLLAAWIGFINASGSEAHWLLLLALSLPFQVLGLLVLARGIQAFGRQKG